MRVVGIKSITLSLEQQKKCKEFADKSAKSQQPIEFGNRELPARGIPELSRDTLIGKLAEVAFAEFLKNTFGIETELDFNIYPRGEWDKNDFILNDRIIDVKATRSGGRWLLIELNKLGFRRSEGKLPDYFLSAAAGWDRYIDKPTGIIQLMGYAAINKICHTDCIGVRNARICEGIPKTQFLSKGSFIPNTHTPLQDDNCARLMANLDIDWTMLIEEIGITLHS